MEGKETYKECYNYIKSLQNQCMKSNVIGVIFSELDGITKCQLRDVMRNVIYRREKELRKVLDDTNNSQYEYLKSLQRQCGYDSITIDFSKLDEITNEQLHNAMKGVVCRREKEVWYVMQGNKIG